MFNPNAKRKQAWLVTINTNSVNEKLIGPLKIVWKYILSNMNRFTYGNVGSQILNVRERSTIERGEKFHRIHLHSKLEITSVGLVSLDYSGIKKFVNRQLKQVSGFGGIMFNAKLIPNYNQIELIQEYLEKAPIDEEEEESGFKILE